MSNEEAIDKLVVIRATMSGDPELAHSRADDVLLELVDAKVKDAYENVVESCGWWACA